MLIGLFFGSFNPVHVGHMIIANHIVEFTALDKVWMIVSPHNPLKTKHSLANDYDRMHLVQLAIGENPNIQASNVEFALPRPSYTIDTLAYLHEKYPEHEFALIMGGDNLATLHKWKNCEKILSDYLIYVYKRPGFQLGIFENHPSIHFTDAPLLDISATFIRKCIKAGKSVQYLLPEPVYEYINGSNMYRT